MSTFCVYINKNAFKKGIFWRIMLNIEEENAKMFMIMGDEI